MFTLIIGGSASGKSAYAEKIAVSLPGPWMYLATMMPYGKDAKDRIVRHRALRAGKGFECRDCYTDIHYQDLAGFNTVLLEDVSNLLANEMFRDGAVLKDLNERVTGEILELSGKVPNLIAVSGDIFSDGINYEGGTALYQDFLSEINRSLANEATVVTEVVCGIPINIKWKTL